MSLTEHQGASTCTSPQRRWLCAYGCEDHHHQLPLLQVTRKFDIAKGEKTDGWISWHSLVHISLLYGFWLLLNVGAVDHRFRGPDCCLGSFCIQKSDAGWLLLACGVTEEGRTSWS